MGIINITPGYNICSVRRTFLIAADSIFFQGFISSNLLLYHVRLALVVAVFRGMRLLLYITCTSSSPGINSVFS